MKRKRMLLVLGVVSVTLTLVVVSLVLATSVTVDDFDDTNATDPIYGVTGLVVRRINAGTSCNSEPSDATGVIGGRRDLFLNHESGSGTSEITINLDGDGAGKFNLGSGVFGHGYMQWDGVDDSCDLDTTGLGGADLTDGGTNSGFQIIVVKADGGFDLGIHVYTDTSHAYYTETVVSTIEDEAVFVDFSEFSGDDIFDDAGAVEFRFLPDQADRDLTIDVFEATSNKDWGDLPDTYSTTLSEDGANHVISGTLYLGTQIDYEADGVPSAGADGDDLANFSDEDGIEEADADTDGSGWMNGTDGGAITVTVGEGSGCLSGWIDWDEDGNFDATEDQIIDGESVSSGEQEVTFDVPANTFGSAGNLNFYARFRLYPDTGAPGCNDESVDYYGEVQGGEVEDYVWEYDGPTAVTFSAIDAGPALTSLPALALVVAAVVAGGAGLFIRKRRA